MKIRVEGTSSEVQMMVEKIRQIFKVRSISPPYKNRGNDNVRVYIEIKDKRSLWHENEKI